MRSKAQQAITNRRKGHGMERDLVKIFKDTLGFLFCKTARLASRMYDNCGVDLYGIPYLVQSKKVKSAIKYSDIFLNIREEVSKNFSPTSPEHEFPIVIFHRRGSKSYEKMVVMQEEDFIELLKKVHGKNTGDKRV